MSQITNQKLHIMGKWILEGYDCICLMKEGYVTPYKSKENSHITDHIFICSQLAFQLYDQSILDGHLYNF